VVYPCSGTRLYGGVPVGTRFAVEPDSSPKPLHSTTSDATPGATPDALTRHLHTPTETDPDLARVIDAWPNLPAHIRSAILALAGTANLNGC
jgi:hypothetical protein